MEEECPQPCTSQVSVTPEIHRSHPRAPQWCTQPDRHSLDRTLERWLTTCFPSRRPTSSPMAMPAPVTILQPITQRRDALGCSRACHTRVPGGPDTKPCGTGARTPQKQSPSRRRCEAAAHAPLALRQQARATQRYTLTHAYPGVSELGAMRLPLSRPGSLGSARLTRLCLFPRLRDHSERGADLRRGGFYGRPHHHPQSAVPLRRKEEEETSGRGGAVAAAAVPELP